MKKIVAIGVGFPDVIRIIEAINKKSKIFGNIYLFSSYIQFILSILTYPIVYIQRCYLMYHKLFKRFNDKNILPSLINCNSSKKL